jgi:hypothetical protein
MSELELYYTEVTELVAHFRTSDTTLVKALQAIDLDNSKNEEGYVTVNLPEVKIAKVCKALNTIQYKI